MSHIRIKTKYNTEGNYGAIDENIIYAHHNLSCDYVTFYYENGEVILTVPDTLDNNILEAINRLYSPFTKESRGTILENDIEYMNQEDRDKIQ
jgi:hypothetical protein